jgi:hypothetical protein
MGKQYNKVLKRARRQARVKRQQAAAKSKKKVKGAPAATPAG